MRLGGGRERALALVLAACGCAGDDEVVAAQAEDATERTFQRHFVLSDEALEDAGALDVAAVQAFLEVTPHGNRSVLADHRSGAVSAAEAFIAAATKHGINPLVLLTRAQLEQSLVGKSSASATSLDWAMGCGCPDGGECFEAMRGFATQVDCAAAKLRSYIEQQREGGETAGGWRVGKPKATLDGGLVTPSNMTTAAIYTYTPWLSSARTHAGLWRSYALHVGYVTPAPEGCEVLTFASGASIQLRPAPALAAEYEDLAPRCFVVVSQLLDPVDQRTFDASLSLGPHFRLSEFTAKAKKELLVAPRLVDTLEVMRTTLGSAISVKQAFRSPGAHAGACGSAASCDATRELTAGTAAIVSSSAGKAAVMQAAADAGATSCWTTSEGVFVGTGPGGQGCPSP
jgi:hypothetical protein